MPWCFIVSKPGKAHARFAAQHVSVAKASKVSQPHGNGTHSPVIPKAFKFGLPWALKQNEQDNYDKIPYLFEVSSAFKPFRKKCTIPQPRLTQWFPFLQAPFWTAAPSRPTLSHIVPRCTAPRHLDCRRLNPAPRSSHPRNSWLPPPIGFRLWMDWCQMGMSENVGYIPNEIAIFHRDNDH